MKYGVCAKVPETGARSWFFDYEAPTPEAAERMHEEHLTAYKNNPRFRTDLPLEVHEHDVTGKHFYCVPCEHAPCKYRNTGYSAFQQQTT